MTSFQCSQPSHDPGLFLWVLAVGLSGVLMVVAAITRMFIDFHGAWYLLAYPAMILIGCGLNVWANSKTLKDSV